MTRGETPVGDLVDLAAAGQPIRAIMTTDPVTVEQHASLREVAKELASADIGVVLVDSPVGPVGLVSERDVVGVVAAGGDVELEQARTVMAVDLVAAAPTDSIAAVGLLMIDAGVRHVAVRSGDGRTLGLVSMRDVLDALLA